MGLRKDQIQFLKKHGKVPLSIDKKTKLDMTTDHDIDMEVGGKKLRLVPKPCNRFRAYFKEIQTVMLNEGEFFLRLGFRSSLAVPYFRGGFQPDHNQHFAQWLQNQYGLHLDFNA